MGARSFVGFGVAMAAFLAVDIAVLSAMWDAGATESEARDVAAATVVARVVNEAVANAPVQLASARSGDAFVPATGEVAAGSKAPSEGLSVSRGPANPADRPGAPSTRGLSPAVLGPTSPKVVRSPTITATASYSAGIPVNPHTSADLKQTCTNCHAEKAVSPLSKAHPGSGAETCLACHLVPRVAPVGAPHPPDGYGDCLGCHVAGKDGPLPPTHRAYSNSSCLACHPARPTSAGTPTRARASTPTRMPTAVTKEAVANPHTGADLRQSCANCHAPKAISPLSAKHPETISDSCDRCHRTPATPPEAMPHPPNGYWACLACHTAGRDGALPDSHTARPESSCLACHPAAQLGAADGSPAPAERRPTATPTVTKAVANPHTGADLRQSCANCHAPKAVSPLSAKHPASTAEACGGCHRRPAVPPQAMPHPQSGYWACLSCHVSGSAAALPADHRARGDSSCVACHPARERA